MKTIVRKDYTHHEPEWADGSHFVIITAYRRENLGKPIYHMFDIRRIMDEYADIKAIYPIKINPIVWRIDEKKFCDCDNVYIIELLGVLDFYNFLSRCYMN